MEYRLRWVPNVNFLRWSCTFNLFGVDFICVGSRFSVEYGLIIHCNANGFDMRPRVGLDPQRVHFTLEIPTCWYLKTLADPTQASADPTRASADPTRASGIYCKPFNLSRVGDSRWTSKERKCFRIDNFTCFSILHYSLEGPLNLERRKNSLSCFLLSVSIFRSDTRILKGSGDNGHCNNGLKFLLLKFGSSLSIDFSIDIYRL